MLTKNKPVTHLRKGDVLIIDAVTGPKQWVVFDAKPHESLRSHTAIRFSYEEAEPDGEGGHRIVAKVTNVMAFDDRDHFAVVSK